MEGKQRDPMDVFDLFGADLTRRVPVVASEHPVSTGDPARPLDASRPTIYRRLDAHLEDDLLDERQPIDAEGNDDGTFEATLDRIAFEVDDGGNAVDVQLRRNPIDRFDGFRFLLGASDVGETAGEGARSGTTETRRDTHHG